jgi:hypothetical protein
MAVEQEQKTTRKRRQAKTTPKTPAKNKGEGTKPVEKAKPTPKPKVTLTEVATDKGNFLEIDIVGTGKYTIDPSQKLRGIRRGNVEALGFQVTDKKQVFFV